MKKNIFFFALLLSFNASSASINDLNSSIAQAIHLNHHNALSKQTMPQMQYAGDDFSTHATLNPNVSKLTYYSAIG